MPATASFFIGWDVGGWNCDKNGTSRDALVILDAAGALRGNAWRGNLRSTFSAPDTREWLQALFDLCRTPFPNDPVSVSLAIDAPLGFPTAFTALIKGQSLNELDVVSARNAYLFRQTERHLFDRGHAPLSAIKDMIGSQATKGMHVLARYAPHREHSGVWTDGQSLRAIETYPAVCRKTPLIKQLLRDYPSLGHADKDDALVCALIAKIFATAPDQLEPPLPNTPPSEGWIWVPAA